jgi:hypothetical protein
MEFVYKLSIFSTTEENHLKPKIQLMNILDIQFLPHRRCTMSPLRRQLKLLLYRKTMSVYSKIHLKCIDNCQRCVIFVEFKKKDGGCVTHCP